MTLTTEQPTNIPFYERRGYRRTGQTTIPGRLTSWGFVRPDAAKEHQ